MLLVCFFIIIYSKARIRTCLTCILVIGKDLANFKKSKSSWATVANKTALPLPQAEPSSPQDIKPAIKQEPDIDGSATTAPVQMTKRRGGLRTAAQLREDTEREMAEQRSPSPDEGEERADPTETVHRDVTGRIIDVKKLHEEEKGREEEERRKEAERKEWTKGMVQRKNREENRRLEKEMAAADVGRSRDDVRMNREMKEEERWNDPAAAFLTVGIDSPLLHCVLTPSSSFNRRKRRKGRDDQNTKAHGHPTGLVFLQGLDGMV